MTLDYKKMFLIVTEEAVVKGHFTIVMALYRTRCGVLFLCPDPDGENKKQAAERPPNTSIIPHSPYAVKRFYVPTAQICMLHKDLLCILYTIDS